MRTDRHVLKVDIIACDGRGVCAELFPERIRLDDWGYPIIDADPFGPFLIAHARRAVAACPVLALRLERYVPAGRDDP
jgi:ferredoxin